MSEFDFSRPLDLPAIEAWTALPIAERIERNRRKMRSLVIRWDTLCQSPRVGDFNGKGRLYSQRIPDSEPPLFYLHIPKSGGTTLEYLIAKNYRVNGILHLNAPEAMRNPALLYKKNTLPRRALMGHYHFDHVIYQAFDRPFVHITLLREPVSRVISYYNYLCMSPNHPYHKKAISCRFDEFVQSTGVVELRNGQVLRLSGYMGSQIDDDQTQLWQKILDLAKDNLCNFFSFFGIQDKYVKFLLMAKKNLGWSDIFHRHHNVSRYLISENKIDSATLELIRKLNSYDIELYKFATELFENRCQQLEITPEQVRRFNQANSKYIRLLSAF